MWDYATGLPFQHLKDVPQPGSLDAEAVRYVFSANLLCNLTGAGRLLLFVRPNRN
jgi:hypothetical protein